MGPWDRGASYEYAYNLIMSKLRRATRLSTRCYLYILLIQLRNGSRVSEAVRAFKEFVTKHVRECEVLVSKKKNKEARPMVLPSELSLDDLSKCSEFVTVDDKRLVNRVKVFAVRNLKLNTHSLRYAFITYLVRQGVSPVLIARLTHHSKLDYIVHYTQSAAARDLLKQL